MPEMTIEDLIREVRLPEKLIAELRKMSASLHAFQVGGPQFIESASDRLGKIYAVKGFPRLPLPDVITAQTEPVVPVNQPFTPRNKPTVFNPRPAPGGSTQK